MTGMSGIFCEREMKEALTVFYEPFTLNLVSGNVYLNGVTFTRIGNNAFHDCENLTSVIFGTGSNITTEFGTNAFFNTAGTADLWTKYGAVTRPFTANTRFNRSGDVWTRQ